MRRPFVIALIVVLVAAAGYATARVKRDFWDFEVITGRGGRVLAAEPLYRADDGHYQYKYWPTFALAMAPFALLPLEVGKVVWYALIGPSIARLFIDRSIARLLPDRRSSRPVRSPWVTLLLTGKFIVQGAGQRPDQRPARACWSRLALRRREARRRDAPASWSRGGDVRQAVRADASLPWLVVDRRASTAVGASRSPLRPGLLLPGRRLRLARQPRRCSATGTGRSRRRRRQTC